MSQIRNAKKDLLSKKTLSNENQPKFINNMTKLGSTIENIFTKQETKLGEELAKAKALKKGEDLSKEEIENLSKPFKEKMQQLAVEKAAVYEQIGALYSDD